MSDETETTWHERGRVAQALPPSLFCVALMLCNCSVDDRTLRLGGSEAGATGAQEAGGAGGGDDAEPGNAGGVAGATGGDGLVNGCADLDTDGIADCDVTLLRTAAFHSDVSGWTPVGPAELTWDSKNARDDRPSGSGRLSARMAPARAFQCVALMGPQLVIGYADAFVEEGHAGAGRNQALLEVSFFEDEGCQGERQRYFETPPSELAEAWSTIHAGGLATEGTRSVAVALVAANAASPSEVKVYFDNVMLKAQAP